MYLGFSFGAGGSSGDNIYHYIILGLNWAWARKLKIGHDVGSALFRAVERTWLDRNHRALLTIYKAS
jgi:hypothetical protein